MKLALEIVMQQQNEPEQMEFDFDKIDPVCRMRGCMQQQHFRSIRQLQQVIAKLEEKLRAYEQS